MSTPLAPPANKPDLPKRLLRQRRRLIGQITGAIALLWLLGLFYLIPDAARYLAIPPGLYLALAVLGSLVAALALRLQLGNLDARARLYLCTFPVRCKVTRSLPDHTVLVRRGKVSRKLPATFTIRAERRDKSGYPEVRHFIDRLSREEFAPGAVPSPEGLEAWYTVSGTDRAAPVPRFVLGVRRQTETHVYALSLVCEEGTERGLTLDFWEMVRSFEITGASGQITGADCSTEC